MRITGGTLRGREVRVPDAVRPTQDMVRQALFSMLGESICGARFMDLYAGTGAVGMEAHSRGAVWVCWVELNRKVFPVLRDNVKALCGETGELVQSDTVAYLKRNNPGEPFDIVFADPPYRADHSGKDYSKGVSGRQMMQVPEGVGWLPAVLNLLRAGHWLRDGGLVIVEQAVGACGLLGAEWQVIKERQYGSAQLMVLRMGLSTP